eukprot:1152332-Pelagomonas_calceolata.AAC.15
MVVHQTLPRSQGVLMGKHIAGLKNNCQEHERTILGREGLGWEGTQEKVPTTPQPPPGQNHLTLPREKGPEWDYVTLVQPEGTDEVKQGKNKCKLCEHVFHGGAHAMRIRLHFVQVPGCGVAKCPAAEDTWVAVDEDEEGEEGSSSDGEGWFTGDNMILWGSSSSGIFHL